MLEGCSDELAEDWLSFNNCLWFLKLVYLFKTVLYYIPSISQYCRYARYKGRRKLNLFHFRSSLCIKIGRIIGTHLSVCGCLCVCVCVCLCVCEEYILKSCTYVSM